MSAALSARELKPLESWIDRMIKLCISISEECCNMSKVQGNFTVTVQPSTEPNPLVMTPQGGNLPGETQGVAIAGDPVCVVSGGTAPYEFSVTAGTLPPGLALISQPQPDGSEQIAIAGTPTQSGAFSFTLEVTDAAGATASTTVTG
jgi:hypothetical protein